MNYYPHHIGDFNNSTRHLTRLERGIYRDLIELYYDTEQQLTSDIPALCRKILARSNDEITAVEQVLNEFFTETEQGWNHDRCEKEIKKYHGNIEAKSAAGKASAAKRANKNPINNKMLDASTTAVQQLLDKCSTNQEPITKNQEPIIKKEKKETVAPSGFTEFWNLYPSHPRKGGKDKCLKLWISRKLENKAQQILNHLAWQKKDWAKSNNEYVQMPQSYLNAAKWDGWVDMGEQKRERGFVS